MWQTHCGITIRKQRITTIKTITQYKHKIRKINFFVKLPTTMAYLTTTCKLVEEDTVTGRSEFYKKKLLSREEIIQPVLDIPGFIGIVADLSRSNLEKIIYILKQQRVVAGFMRQVAKLGSVCRTRRSTLSPRRLRWATVHVDCSRKWQPFDEPEHALALASIPAGQALAGADHNPLPTHKR